MKLVVLLKKYFFINKDIFEKLLIRNDTKNLTIKKSILTNYQLILFLQNPSV